LSDGVRERTVTYQLDPSFLTRLFGSRGVMRARILERPDLLRVSQMNETGANLCSITEDLHVSTNPDGVGTLYKQHTICNVNVNSLVNNRAEKYWQTQYRIFHESGSFIKEYNLENLENEAQHIHVSEHE
jgi:hypothetical protein